MTRKEAKELLAIIQAFANGKTIQERKLGTTDWVDTESPWFNPGWAELRIKPECEYRPFNTQKECWNEMQKHQPFGWIKDKDSQIYENCSRIYDNGIFGESFNNAYKYYTFADGTPFGIKEDEL